MAFSDAFTSSFSAVSRGLQAKDEQRWLDEQRARQRADWARQDAARTQLGQLQNDAVNGVVVPGTDNSSDMVEDQRLGMPVRASTTQRRAMTDGEVEGRLGQIALGSGDVAGYRSSRENKKKLDLESGRREAFKRFKSMSPEQLASEVGGALSSDPNFPGMLDWDPKSKKFMLVSKVEGLPSQTFSHEEFLGHAMAAWEAGNGDTQAGVQAMLGFGKLGRDLQNSNYERSAKLAGLKANTQFEGEKLDIQRSTADAQKAHWEAQAARDKERLGIDRSRAARENAGMERLRMGDKLAQEAAGLAQGMVRARAAGAREAEQIYAEQLAGVNARMRGLGLQPIEPLGKTQPEVHFKDTADGGLYFDPSGRPIARHDPKQGMVPLGKDPDEANPKALQERAKYGIQKIPIETGDGRVAWGFTGADGVYDNQAEALKSIVKAHHDKTVGAGRGLRNPPMAIPPDRPPTGVNPYRPMAPGGSGGYRPSLENPDRP